MTGSMGPWPVLALNNEVSLVVPSLFSFTARGAMLLLGLRVNGLLTRTDTRGCDRLVGARRSDRELSAVAAPQLAACQGLCGKLSRAGTWLRHSGAIDCRDVD